MLPLYLQFALIVLAASVQPFVVPLFLEQKLGSMSAVFVFLCAWPLAVLVGLMPCFNLAARGNRYRWVMSLGLGYLALYQLMLASLGSNDTLTLGALVVVYALHCGLFWLPRHVLVSFATASHRVGAQTSTMQLIALGVGVLAPITAGAVAERLSFEASFLVAASFALLSIFPLFLKSLVLPESEVLITSARETLRLPFSSTLHRVHFCEGVTEISFTMCWTFAFMHAVGGLERFGLIIGLSALVAGAVSIGAGRRFDRRNRVSLLYGTTLLRWCAMLSYLLIAIFPSPLLVLLIDVIFRIVDAAHGTVRGAYIFGLSNKLSPVAFQYNREFALNSGRASAAAILAVLTYFGDLSLLWVAMAVGACAQLGWLWLHQLDPELEEALSRS